MPRQTITLSEAITQYLDITRARRGEARSNSVEQAENVLRMFERLVGDRQAMGITSDHFEAFFYGPTGVRSRHRVQSRNSRDGWAPPVGNATHNFYRSRLKTFTSWCVNKGYMKSGLVADVFDKNTGIVRPLKIQRASRQRPAVPVLISFLEHAANPRDRAYLATALNTALRSIEIRMLRVGNVDLAAGWLYVTISKTGGTDDQPITMDLDRELRVWLEQYEADLGRPLEPDDYLFPRRTGGLISHYDITEDGERVCVRQPYRWRPEVSVTNTHLIVQHVLRALGLPTKREGSHTIRRAVAQAYFQEVAQEKGDVAAMRETAALLHHSNLATTEIYLDMTPEKNRRDNRLKGKPFLSALVSQENVVPLRPKAQGE